MLAGLRLPSWCITAELLGPRVTDLGLLLSDLVLLLSVLVLLLSASVISILWVISILFAVIPSFHFCIIPVLPAYSLVSVVIVFASSPHASIIFTLSSTIVARTSGVHAVVVLSVPNIVCTITTLQLVVVGSVAIFSSFGVVFGIVAVYLLPCLRMIRYMLLRIRQMLCLRVAPTLVTEWHCVAWLFPLRLCIFPHRVRSNPDLVLCRYRTSARLHFGICLDIRSTRLVYLVSHHYSLINRLFSFDVRGLRRPRNGRIFSRHA